MRISDWSSDVCSSDLVIGTAGAPGAPGVEGAEGVVIQVSDTGVGIAAEHLDKVMSPFGQVHEALNRETQGTGLGLPLSKALVDLHGGRLRSEEHTSELQSLMRISYAVFCLKKKNNNTYQSTTDMCITRTNS